MQDTVSQVLGIKPEDVACHVTLLGGAFGRKSKPDYCAEAAVLSKKLGKPVKVAWSREDDIQHDFYHSVAAMQMRAADGCQGQADGVAAAQRFSADLLHVRRNDQYGDLEMTMGWNDLPFDIPNHRAENGEAVPHVRIGWMRSVANVYHAFARDVVP